MTDAVKLTPDQVAKLGDIMDNTRSRFEEVHQEMNAKGKAIWDEQTSRINAILTPEQRPLYQQLRDKHAREREAREKRHGIQQDPPKK
jgi:Spy/CpxP family protein refolding chaperone